jgi:DNA-directed RNA polymerase subunit RPC12/RpoP
MSDISSPSAGSAAEHRFPCAQCGANLRFAPGQTRLTCEYCGHEQPIPDATAEDRENALKALDYHEALRDRLPADDMEETRVLSCPSCGAQVEFEPETHSTECPFCASPVVTDTGIHRHIKPQALIPFVLDERQARDAMKKWLKKLWFAPSGLSKFARNDRKLNGLYVPYWSFDAFASSHYRGERGTYYYETRTRTKNGKRVSERVRRVRWTPVSGHVTRQFFDVLIMAAQSLPRRYVRGLEPWRLSELVPYTPDYLSGFRAEGYTVELDGGHTLARERMDEQIRQDIRRHIGGDEQRIHATNLNLSNEMFKHVLLPIWMAAYRYRDKTYRFVVNAQTGRVQGERPWSVWKIASAVVLILAIIAMVIYFGEVQ